MSEPESVEACVAVATSTIRWILGGILFVAGAIIKLEFNRIWKSIYENKKNILEHNGDATIKYRVKALEMERQERKERDKELFALIRKMDEKLHQHIESAVSTRTTSETQTIRKVLREEFSKIKD